MKRWLIAAVFQFVFCGCVYAQEFNAPSSMNFKESDDMHFSKLLEGYASALGLLIVVGGVLIVLRKRLNRFQPNTTNNTTIKVVARKQFSAKSQLLIVEVEGKKLAIVEGATALPLTTESPPSHE